MVGSSRRRCLDHGPGAAANDRQVLAHHRPPHRADVGTPAAAQLAQVGLGGHAAVEADQPPAGTETAFQGLNHRHERRRVAAVAGPRFLARREAVAVDDQADRQLLAIGPMVARVAALGLGVVIQAALEIGAGQVVQEQVVAEVNRSRPCSARCFSMVCLCGSTRLRQR